MKLSKYQRSRSFFDLVKGHSDFKVKLFDFGRYTQVSDSGPHGPLLFHLFRLQDNIPVKQLKILLLQQNIFYSVDIP